MIGRVTCELGFDWYALVEEGDPAQLASEMGHTRRGEFVALSNFPFDWLQVYETEGMIAADPVILAARDANGGFVWSDLPRLIEWTPVHKAMMARAAEYGLRDGFTVPCFIDHEMRGACSFVVGPGTPLPTSELAMAELVGHYAFEAARTMMQRARNDHSGGIRLSPRQIECIELIALGKTDWETAQILGISEATVKEYVNDARRRYGVGKRVQLVLRAVFDGHIQLRDILNPDV